MSSIKLSGVLLLFLGTILSTGTKLTTLTSTFSETISLLYVDLALILNSVIFKSFGTVKKLPSVTILINWASDGLGLDNSSLIPFWAVPSGLKVKNFEISVLSPLTTGITLELNLIDEIGFTTLTVICSVKLPSKVLTVMVTGPPCCFASKTPMLFPSLTVGFPLTTEIKSLIGTLKVTAPSYPFGKLETCAVIENKLFSGLSSRTISMLFWLTSNFMFLYLSSLQP